MDTALPEDLEDRIASLDLEPGAVAAFDADDTLWHGDAGIGLLRWCSERRLLVGEAGGAGVFAAYEQARRLDEEEGLRRCALAYAGLEVEAVAAHAEEFFAAEIEAGIFPRMRRLIERLAAAGVEVWIVTASPLFAALPGAARLGIPASRVVGIEVEVEEGRYTDRLASEVTYRDGKPRLLAARASRPPSLAVGNGQNDLELLESATGLAIAVNPRPGPRRDGRPGLKEAAASAGWAVLELEDPRPHSSSSSLPPASR